MRTLTHIWPLFFIFIKFRVTFYINCYKNYIIQFFFLSLSTRYHSFPLTPPFKHLFIHPTTQQIKYRPSPFSSSTSKFSLTYSVSHSLSFKNVRMFISLKHIALHIIFSNQPISTYISQSQSHSNPKSIIL